MCPLSPVPDGHSSPCRPCPMEPRLPRSPAPLPSSRPRSPTGVSTPAGPRRRSPRSKGPRCVLGWDQDEGRGGGGRRYHRRDLCSVGEPATSPDLLLFSSVTLGRSPAPKPRSHCPLISYMGHGGGWGGAVQNWCSPPRPCLAQMSQNPVAMRATREYVENSVGSESVLQVRLQG